MTAFATATVMAVRTARNGTRTVTATAGPTSTTAMMIAATAATIAVGRTTATMIAMIAMTATIVTTGMTATTIAA